MSTAESPQAPCTLPRCEIHDPQPIPLTHSQGSSTPYQIPRVEVSCGRY